MLHTSAFSLAGLGMAGLMRQDGLMAASKEAAPSKPQLEEAVFDLSEKKPAFQPRAKAMISMFMLGGPSQIDLFDPKPELYKRHGQPFEGKLKFDNSAQASREIMAPLWDFKARGQCGTEISDLLPHLGSIADDITLIRSMHSGANNHLPANYALNTGMPTKGRAVLGSWLLHALGSETQNLPAYVASPIHGGFLSSAAKTGPMGGYPPFFKERWSGPKRRASSTLSPLLT